MITASALLSAVPNLPPHSRDTLQRLVDLGHDPQIHIPGLPALPAVGGIIGEAAKSAIVAALAPFDFTFYQTIGVRVSMKGGSSLVGIGASLNETLNLANPVPNVKIAPVLELGNTAVKE